MEALRPITDTYGKLAMAAPRIWLALVILFIIIYIWKVWIMKTWKGVFEGLVVVRKEGVDTGEWRKLGSLGPSLAFQEAESGLATKGTTTFSTTSGFKSDPDRPAFWDQNAEIAAHQADVASDWKKDLTEVTSPPKKEGLESVLTKALTGG